MNIEKFYDAFTKKLISDYLYSNPRTEAGIALALHWIPNNAEKILDIGCGIGWTSHEYACKYQNAEILGIDLSANSISVAKTLFNNKNNLSYEKVDVTKSNFTDSQKYDAIVMLDVYEHIALSDREKFIESISKILNPKGIVIFSCPSIYHQFYLKHENPSGLQPVDEDVNIEDIYYFAKKINGDVVFFNYISVWHTNDYFHAVIKNDVSLNDSRNKKTFFFDKLESKQNRIKRVKQSQYISMFEELLKNKTIAKNKTMKKNIALISPDKNAISETFIQAHKKYFNANVYYYFDGITQLENDGLLKITKLQRIIRKIKDYLNIKQPSIWEMAIINSFTKNKIDKVYAEYGTTGVVIMPICKKLNIPLIVNFHGYDSSICSVLNDNEKQYKELFDFAEDIVVVSKNMREKLILLGARPEKITYTPCAPNNIFFDFNPTFSENSFIAVGRFVNKKAPYYTILAFQKVIENHPDAKLYFCGDGLLFNMCVNLANYLKISSNILFLGSVPTADLKNKFECVMGFVQHSITTMDGDMEGTPVAVLEASAAGLPVISTNHAGIPDVILHEKTGLLVNEHDVNKMAEYMIYLLENKEYAKSLGEKGREYIKSSFSMEHHIEILNKLLNK